MNMLIKIRNFGNITIEMWPEIAPIACAKVLEIAKMGRYAERRVERLEPGFVFQPVFYDGTDPVMDEMIELEAKTNVANGAVRFTRGIVAMAGSAEEACAAQYFITLQPKDRLNGNFTVIGKVIDGWEVLEKVEEVPVLEGNLGSPETTFHYPAEDIIVEQVLITE